MGGDFEEEANEKVVSQLWNANCQCLCPPGSGDDNTSQYHDEHATARVQLFR